MATQPRLPGYDQTIVREVGCFTVLAAALRADDGRPEVVGGEVAVGSKVEILSRDARRVTVADIVRLYLGQTRDPELLQRADERKCAAG